MARNSFAVLQSRARVSKAVLASKSIKECLEKLGLNQTHYSRTQLKIACAAFDIALHFPNARARPAISDAKLFRRNSTYTNNNRLLKQRFIARTQCEQICVLCGQPPHHNGLPLTLQLDHINGDKFDNRLSNLRLLCPNCHTQTPTYAGKRTTRRIAPRLCVYQECQREFYPRCVSEPRRFCSMECARRSRYLAVSA